MRLTDDDEVLEVLRGYFDDDQIEERLGGTLDLSTPEVIQSWDGGIEHTTSGAAAIIRPCIIRTRESTPDFSRRMIQSHATAGYRSVAQMRDLKVNVFS